jgi:hypothetical protein
MLCLKCNFKTNLQCISSMEWDSCLILTGLSITESLKMIFHMGEEDICSQMVRSTMEILSVDVLRAMDSWGSPTESGGCCASKVADHSKMGRCRFKKTRNPLNPHAHQHVPVSESAPFPTKFLKTRSRKFTTSTAKRLAMARESGEKLFRPYLMPLRHTAAH